MELVTAYYVELYDWRMTRSTILNTDGTTRYWTDKEAAAAEAWERRHDELIVRAQAVDVKVTPAALIRDIHETIPCRGGYVTVESVADRTYSWNTPVQHYVTLPGKERQHMAGASGRRTVDTQRELQSVHDTYVATIRDLLD